MQISLVKEGLLANGQLSTWSARTYARIRDSLRGGMQRGGSRIAAEARAHVQTKLKGKRAAQSIRHRVWDRDRSRLPGLQVSSKIPWLGVHERGRTLSGHMLIPFGSGARMKRSDWKKFIERLFAEGRGFYLKSRRSGARVLMARPAGKGDGLTRFRSGLRKRIRAQGGTGRISRTRPIPVALLVTRVTIKRRLNIEQIVKRGLPIVVRGMA